MSKQHLSVRVPSHIRDDIEEIQEQEGYEEQSEAARQVIRRGLQTYEGTATPGETLGQQATTVAGVGTVAAAIAFGLGQPWASALVVPFGVTTFVFGLVWASVRTLAGRELV